MMPLQQDLDSSVGNKSGVASLAGFSGISSPSLQLAFMGLDHSGEKMEAAIRKYGSRTLRGCLKSATPFSRRVVEVRQLMCKLT